MRTFHLAGLFALLLLALSATALYLAGLIIHKIQHTTAGGWELAGTFATIAYAGWLAARLTIVLKETK